MASLRRWPLDVRYRRKSSLCSRHHRPRWKHLGPIIQLPYGLISLHSVFIFDLFLLNLFSWWIFGLGFPDHFSPRSTFFWKNNFAPYVFRRNIKVDIGLNLVHMRTHSIQNFIDTQFIVEYQFRDHQTHHNSFIQKTYVPYHSMLLNERQKMTLVVRLVVSKYFTYHLQKDSWILLDWCRYGCGIKIRSLKVKVIIIIPI